MIGLETATALEVARTVIASSGVLAGMAALLFTVRDWRVLRDEGVNGPTNIVYAQKTVLGAVILSSQSAYVVVGVSAMLAPSPVPPEIASALSLISANASMSVQTYLSLALYMSILIAFLMLTGSLWQLGSRHALATALRSRGAHAVDQAARQAQSDRMEATGVDTNNMLRRGDIGRGQKAAVDREQATRIETTGEETADRLRRDGIGGER